MLFRSVEEQSEKLGSFAKFPRVKGSGALGAGWKYGDSVCIKPRNVVLAFESAY